MQDVQLGSMLSASGALGGALESIEMPRTSLSPKHQEVQLSERAQPLGLSGSFAEGRLGMSHQE